MGIIKVSVFQKSLPEGLNLTIFKRLAALKSDFLIFPQYFFADSNVRTLADALARSGHALEWLLKLNDAYQGIIIGGNLFLEENEQTFLASPVISRGEVVDWYRKRNLTRDEARVAVAGSEPGIFILQANRFAVLIGEDVHTPEYLQEIHDMGVRILFVVMGDAGGDERVSSPDEYDEKFFLQPARDLDLYTVRCCPTGTLFGTEIRGRSMVMTPSGISWRVAPQEEESEILKTVMVNVPG